MERRHTIQRDLVLSAVRQLKDHATAEEIYKFITIDHPSVGKGTVYRNLSILADEGEIRKVEIPGTPDRYDHIRQEHYHMLCVRCKKVFDADMDIIPDMQKRIRNNRGMEILSCEVLIKGICPECQKKK